MSVVAIVLAGGASARFGGDKLGSELDGRPLVHHAIDACALVAPAIVLVLAPAASTPRLPPDPGHRVVVTHDHARHQGPLAGLVAGLEAAPTAMRDADVALVVGGDMPALQPEVLGLLIGRVISPAAPGTFRPDAAALEAAPPATLPMAVRIQAAAPVARALLDEERRSLRALLDRLPSVRIDAATWRALDPEGRTISDVDTPDDLRAAHDRAPGTQRPAGPGPS